LANLLPKIGKKSWLRNDRELVEYITDRLTEIGESLPKAVPTFKLDVNPYKDPDIYDYTRYLRSLVKRCLTVQL